MPLSVTGTGLPSSDAKDGSAQVRLRWTPVFPKSRVVRVDSCPEIWAATSRSLPLCRYSAIPVPQRML